MDKKLEEQILHLALSKNEVTPQQLESIEKELREDTATRGPGQTVSPIELMVKRGLIQQSRIEVLEAELQLGETAHDPRLSTQPTAAGSPPRDKSGTSVSPEFGRYRNLEFLGQGGMAKVYKAFDPSLQRTIALKFLRAETPELAERLAVEARSQARIEHEHVCKVYEVGEIDGRNYIAMQFIHGETLKDISGSLTLDQKAKLMLYVAEAVHAAHRAGLIHRDLKPANVMVEKREDGTLIPYVMDFGLAREVEAHGLTMSGITLGTPSYMPPEQAKGDLRRVDHRSDIYSIGATLYELVTGRLPFEGDTSVGILLKVIQQEPPSPRQANPAVSQDLETIILKCMEKEQDRRYQSARELADDLRRYLEGEPVLARRAGWTYRAAKRIKKYPIVSGLLAAAAVVVLVLAGFAVYTWLRAQQQARIADTFGQELDYIQNRIRYTYTAPVHDVRKDEAEMTARLKTLDDRMRQLGPVAYGPGNYVQGRGYLALNQYDIARKHLEAAWQEYDYRVPQAAYAYGLDLAMLYQKELQKIEQNSKDQREVRRKELEKDYRDPALQYIRQGQGTTQATEYVEALIAFLEQRYEDALKKSDEAYTRIPWMYEALMLKANTLTEMAIVRQRVGDFDGAMKLYDQAGSAYQEVLRKAPSDLRGYLSYAHMQNSIMTMYLDQSSDSPQAQFETGMSVLKQAMLVNPRSPEPPTKAALLLFSMGDYLYRNGKDNEQVSLDCLEYAKRAVSVQNDDPSARQALGVAYARIASTNLDHGIDPRPMIDLAVENYKKAEQFSAGALNSYGRLAAAYTLQAKYEMQHGIDARPSMDQTIQFQQKSLDINPTPAALIFLSYSLSLRSQIEMDQGRDPTSFLDRSIEACKKATSINPKHAEGFNALGAAYFYKGRYELDHGLDPRHTLDLAIEGYKAKIKIKPGEAEGYANACEAFNLKAEYEFKTGVDGQSSIEGAVQDCEKAASLDSQMDFVFLNLGAARQYEAAYQLNSSRDPSDSMKKSEAALKHAIEINPEYPDVYWTDARADLVEARWDVLHGRPATSSWSNAATALDRALKLNPQYQDALLTYANLYRMQAEWKISQKRPASDLVESGLKKADLALSANPFSADAQAMKAALLLCRAKAESTNQRGDAKSAMDLLQKAFSMNANLHHQFDPTLEEARKLASQ